MAEQTKTTSKLSLPSDREIVGSRIMDAPPELVFKAYTDPELIPRWWGPRRYATTVDKMDLRPGGVWRFVHRAPDGGVQAVSVGVLSRAGGEGRADPCGHKRFASSTIGSSPTAASGTTATIG